MANSCSALRIVSDNAADRATIVASNTAAGMGVEWLKTDVKDEFCRVLAGSASITLTWPQVETVSCIAVPACNLSADSTIRARAYDATTGGNLLADTGVQYAAPGTILGDWDFTQALNINQFQSDPAVVAVWFDHSAARRVQIDITDPLRTYIDLSRLVVGGHFEPRYSASYGSSFGAIDMTTNTRAASGDIRTSRAPRGTALNLDINAIHEADRHQFARILRAGIGRRHFVSGITTGDDVGLIQDWMIYGPLSTLSDLVFATARNHQAQYQIESW